jgi:cob(I)alamin adenosyltransferase
MARAQMLDREAAAVIMRTQRDLYHVMAELAATKAAAPKFRTIAADHVKYLEEQTDHYGGLIELPREFILSGDSLPGAALDMARAITRRSERRVVKLMDESMIENVWLVRYLNRLSSLLFVLARYEDALSGNSNVTLAKDTSTAQKD